MKINFKYFFVGFCLLGFHCFSQNETKKWYFGANAGLDFVTNPPTILANSAMNVIEGCSSIADNNGNLLFYTDGGIIWNQAHTTMANGNALQGSGSSCQATLILKQPGSTSLYYVFNQRGAMSGFGLQYSIVDMSLAAGMGSVTTKNIPLYTFLCHEKLTATKHCNGTDYWIVIRDLSGTTGASNFHAFLLSSAGVSTIPVTSPMNYPNVTSGYQGALKLSPTGKKLGFVGTLGYFNPISVELYDFDTSTGIVSNSLTLLSAASPAGAYGCEFSNDGTKFYAYTNLNGVHSLNQWDICAGSGTAIVNSKIVVANIQPTVPPINLLEGTMQLASNGKIYIAKINGNPSLDVINNPSIAGSGCNFTGSGQSVAPKLSNFGLPNFPGFHFLKPPPTPPFTSTVSCQSTTFNAPPLPCPASGFTLTGYQWNFGNPGSGTANTSTLANPVHTYSVQGTYTTQLVLYYVYNACGASISDTLRQAVIFQPCISVSSNAINCNSLGSATVNALIGIGPYSYTWMPTGQTGSVATNLGPGTHTVVFYDAGNNITSTATTVFVPAVLLTGTVSASSSVTCNGAATGTAIVSPLSGGSGNQNYIWTNGPLSYTVPNPLNLSAGTWSSVVTDALTGCVVINTFVITQPPPLTLTLSSTPGSCAGSSATLSGVISGGTPTYSYSWVGGAATNTYAVNLSPGSISVYSLVAYDAYSCTVSATLAMSSAPIPTINLNANVVCQGDVFTFTASGGLIYNWSGPQGFNSLLTSNTINPVQVNQGGVYSLTVTAVNGCTASASLNLTVNPTPTLSALGSTVCTMQTISLTANSAPGAGYFWTGPLSFTSNQQSISIPSPSLSQSGVYNLTVTSVDGCTNTSYAIASIVSPPGLTVSLSSASMCAQALSGSPNSIILYSSGAATYTLMTPSHITNTNPSGPNSPVSLSPPYVLPGPATATLVGSNGVCTSSATGNFTVIPNPTVSISTPTPVICAGQTLTYTSAGADSYTWTSSSPNNYIYTTGNIAVANPSINSVFSVVGGSLGCLSALKSHTMTVTPLPVFNIIGNTLICPGTSATLSATTSATLSASGTLYNWSPPLFLNSNNTAVVIASPTSLQNYVVVGSLNSCTTNAMVTVSVMPLPIAQITAPKTTFCRSDEIVMFGGGGPMPITSYTWSGPLNYSLIQKDLHMTVFSPAHSGIYTLTVSDQNGCKGSSFQPITVYDLPTGYLNASALNGCEPFCTGLALKTNSNNPAIASLSWEINGDRLSGNNVNYCFNSPGKHLVWGYLSDVNSCVSTITAVVNVYPKPKANFDFEPQQPIENLEEVRFFNRSLDAEQYFWVLGANQFTSRKKDPTFLFENTGKYPIVLVAYNQWQCSDTIIKTLQVAPDFAVYIPNAFTPNEDNLNEQFKPVLRGAKSLLFSIFDRWGEKIFETTDITKGWDGTYKGEVCKQDVYIWKLNVVAESGDLGLGKQERNLVGEVLLYR